MSGNPTASRLLWFVGIWLASVLALGILAYAIRLLISH
ncbi:MAG TPA: DUF2474 family protein [Devosia sp.]|nr:DUF2474 family protein [Devosia sp.]